MNAKRFMRPMALAVATISVAALGVAGAGSAQAATGTLNISPTSGLDTTPITVSTPQACTAPATNVQAFVTGAGFPTTGLPVPGQSVLGNSPIATYPTNAAGGLDIPLQYTMAQAASLQTPVPTLSGNYTITVICRNSFGNTVHDDFSTTINFSSPTTWAVVSSRTATTTTLSADLASPQVAGTGITFTATVSPAVAGSVQFMDGAATLGAPVTVSAGQATLSVNNLSAATHAISAVFTPADTATYDPSTGTLSYVITAPTATATTTSLTASAASVTLGSPVTFNATVAPAAAAGTVTFADGATTLGTATVSAGSATFTTAALSVGTHSVVASFAPSSASYAASASTAVSVDVTAAGAATTSQNIHTSVAAGTLTISSAATDVTLPALTLNAGATMLTTSGAINDVTVTDTRAATPGFSVTGQVAADFGGSGTINSYNLGWTPSVKSAVGPTVTAGPAVVAGQGLAVGATPADPAVGLKASRTLATGTGNGTAVLGADLSLTAPTSTVAGSYSAALTLTAI